MQSIKNSKGFSLVELMVVVAIIGILAAIAVPNFQRFANKAKQSEARSNLSALYSAERAFFAEWQSFYGGFNNIGYAPTGYLKYSHGFAATGAAPAVGFSGNITGEKSDTAGYCATTSTGKANFCQDPGKGTAGASTPAGVSANATFTAAANGDIGGAVTDQWTIDQSKKIMNTASGI